MNTSISLHLVVDEKIYHVIKKEKRRKKLEKAKLLTYLFPNKILEKELAPELMN